MKNYKQRKEEARQQAIELQIKNFNSCQSWLEVAQNSEKVYELGKKNGLIKEFKENGLL